MLKNEFWHAEEINLPSDLSQNRRTKSDAFYNAEGVDKFKKPKPKNHTMVEAAHESSEEETLFDRRESKKAIYTKSVHTDFFKIDDYITK